MIVEEDPEERQSSSRDMHSITQTADKNAWPASTHTQYTL